MSSFEASAGRPEWAFVPSPIGGLGGGFRSQRDADGATPEIVDPAEAARAAQEAELAAEYARGAEDGRAVAEASLAGPIAAFAKAVRALDDQRTGYLRAQRGLLVDLAVTMAEQIVAREIEVDRAPLATWLDAALEALPADEPIVVQLSSADHAALDAGRLPALAAITADPALRLEPSAGLSAGEARVVQGATVVEVSLTAVLERFREGLRELDAVAPTETPAPGDGEEPA